MVEHIIVVLRSRGKATGRVVACHTSEGLGET